MSPPMEGVACTSKMLPKNMNIINIILYKTVSDEGGLKGIFNYL